MSLDKMAVDKKTYFRFVRVFRPNRFTSLIYACVCMDVCVCERESVCVCVGMDVQLRFVAFRVLNTLRILFNIYNKFCVDVYVFVCICLSDCLCVYNENVLISVIKCDKETATFRLFLIFEMINTVRQSHKVPSSIM
jgi:hypothetical protein